MTPRIDERAEEFLAAILRATPAEVTRRWGKQFWSRFKTKCWKHLEESVSLQEFVANYFALLPSSLTDVLAFLDGPEDEQRQIYSKLDRELAIVIGRVQARIKKIKGDTNNEA